MFRVFYDDRVVSDDIPSLPKTTRTRIKNVVEEKLTTRPEVFGKPLRESLSGFRSLRVGDYRIVYRIESESEVFVLIISHRKDVYKTILKRK